MKHTVLFILVVISVTFVNSQTTSGYQNHVPEAETEDDIAPESETIPESDHEINESTTAPEQSEGGGQTEDEDNSDEDEAYHEDTPDDWETRPENNPVVENGVVNLPFYDFDGPVPNDYFIPAGEWSEPTETNSEPEKGPEYWWENEPEYFYDDEYAYLNDLAMGRAEPEEEAKGEKRAEPEGEIEPEYEAEPEERVEPEFEYLYTFKSENKKFETKKVLRILIAILSVVWGSVGAAIIVLVYKGHVQYREAKLGKLEDQFDVKTEPGKWKLCSTLLSIYYLSQYRQSRELTVVSQEKSDSESKIPQTEA